MDWNSIKKAALVIVWFIGIFLSGEVLFWGSASLGYPRRYLASIWILLGWSDLYLFLVCPPSLWRDRMAHLCGLCTALLTIGGWMVGSLYWHLLLYPLAQFIQGLFTFLAYRGMLYLLGSHEYRRMLQRYFL
ncbi:hypothetical protein D6779_06665 [Candidatus Parcubacteria bacterium]|nr:MAG: hypothetical protein D6779_06665 [Candidatus Parcubacteria bacterium]